MATFESTIKTLLGTLVSGRSYAVFNDASTIVLPYITFQKITGTPWLVSDENADVVRVQIDVFDSTYGGANTLALTVKNALKTSSLVNSRIMISDAFEEVPKEYRVILEYYIWIT